MRGSRMVGARSRGPGAGRNTRSRRARTGPEADPASQAGWPKPGRRNPPDGGCAAEAGADGCAGDRPPAGPGRGHDPLLLQRRSRPGARADPGRALSRMTPGGRRQVSVIVQRDGALHARTGRIPLCARRTLVVAGVALAVVIVLGVAFYAPIVRQAARVPALTRDVERLEIDNQRIRELAAALDDDGFVPRGQAQPGSGEEEHPGIDIAVPVGSVVRAAGGGVVLQTGTEPEYGNFVLVEHPDGYQSMYGHLSRILAVQGSQVRAGEVIAQSGNTGRSTAPHLPFEIRLNGVSIDPGMLVKEER